MVEENDLLTKGAELGYVAYRLYENTDCNKLIFEHLGSFSQPNLKNVGKNDKISSLKVYATWINPYSGEYQYPVITLYQDIDYNVPYGGNSIVFIMEFREYFNQEYMAQIKNLKKYPLYPGSSKNWNDQTSSYKCGIVGNGYNNKYYF